MEFILEMIAAYLIAQSALIDSALEGRGARLYGGRWNNKGVSVVYLASSLSLAMLEIQVNLESYKALLGYSYRRIKFNSKQYISLDQRLLSDHWRLHPAPASTRSIGDRWVNSLDSLLLRVPSTVVPGENNYLLNPKHDDFQHLLMDVPQQFSSQTL